MHCTVVGAQKTNFHIGFCLLYSECLTVFYNIATEFYSSLMVTMRLIVFAACLCLGVESVTAC